MKKASNNLLSVQSALVILGMLTVAGHAQKVVPLASKQGPVISLAGQISGYGDPSAISITFAPSSFGDNKGTFISNPDYPHSVSINSDFTVPGPHAQVLSYYDCDARDHENGVLLCNVPAHSPDHYKCLRIFGGIVQKGSNQVIFPTGAKWEIGFKTTGVVGPQGILAGQVIYAVIR